MDKKSELSQATEVWTESEGGVAAPRGFYATGVQAGIKYKDKYDVAVICSRLKVQAAGVYTRNLVKAHPLVLTQKHLQNGVAQAIVVNSGNANACLGEAGDRAALEMAQAVAECLAVPAEDVIVASTGVIGAEMPMDRILSGIRAAGGALWEEMAKDAGTADTEKPYEMRETEKESAHRAALAIMTTDTMVKEKAFALPCTQGGMLWLGGMAKGSGMIHPNMGTMLGFLTTDAKLPAAELQRILKEAVDESFNMITVDGDTSTNDMVVLLANGMSGIVPEGEDLRNFEEMVKSLCRYLAQEIARDGEGAGKFLEVLVTGAQRKDDAQKMARCICGSSLVKTAVCGEDANWGRVIMAAGNAGAEFEPDRVDIFLGDLMVARAGCGLAFSEERAKDILSLKEIQIRLDLHMGDAQAAAWGCDLTHDYITINGSYRT